ncbi:MAG: DUF4232 domain-containing protein [Streptosporangiaceae bacterium]
MQDPIGPLPPRTYWRRRALILCVVLAVVGLAAWACTATGDAHRNGRAPADARAALPTALPTVTTTVTVTATPRSSPSSSASPSARAGPSARAAGPAPCGEDDLAVSAEAGEDSYAPKQRPAFTVHVENSGDGPCRVDVGSKSLSLVITSGHDHIWSTDDCAKHAKSATRTLKPGKSYETTITWKRRRSSPEECKGEGETAKPGWYVATPRVGDIEGDKAVFRLR